MLRTGDQAPPFRGRDQHGREVALAELLARGPVVLYFYPKAFTRVCTQEARMFEDARPELAELGAQIVGVSIDDEPTMKRFAEHERVQFPMLSDVNREITRAYDVLQPFDLFSKRVTFVIDMSGTIRGTYHYELRAKRHVEKVRALLGELAQPAARDSGA